MATTREKEELEDTETDASYLLSPEEGRKLLDEAAHHWIGIPGEEFLRRWDAGEYRDLPDTPAGWRIMRVVGLISFARQDP